MSDSVVMYVLGGVNAVLAVAGGLWLAGETVRVRGGRTWKWLLALWGIYLAECVAFSASMATNVLSFVLAVIWGFVFARWVEDVSVQPAYAGQALNVQREDKKRLVWRLTLYTCLPAVSFLSVFVLMIIGGWPIFTREGGYKFGVPDFVPWPFCTVTGFFAACVGSAVVVKTAVTTAIAFRWMANNDSPQIDTD